MTKRQAKKALRKAAMSKVATIQAASMKSIFSPIAHIMALKEQDMDEAVRAARKLQKFLNGEAHLDDEVDAEEGDKLEVDFEEKFYKQRAFADHPEADKMRAIADYSDKWFDIKQARGSFNVYYVCKAGAVLWECNTVITATEWERLHDDVTASKQR